MGKDKFVWQPEDIVILEEGDGVEEDFADEGEEIIGDEEDDEEDDAP